MEDRLVDRLEQLAQRFLHDLVLGRRDADRAALAVLLRDLNPTDRLVPPSLRPQPLMEVPDVAFQLLPILLLRDAFDADRRIRAEAVVGTRQLRLINEVRQRQKCELWVLRSLHYLEKLG